MKQFACYFLLFLLSSFVNPLFTQRAVDAELLSGMGVAKVNQPEPAFTSSSVPDIVPLGKRGFLLDTYFEPARNVFKGIPQTESHRLVFRDTSMQDLFEVTHRIPAACRVMASQVNGSRIRLAYAVPKKSFRVYVVTADLESRTSWYSIYESPMKGIVEMDFFQDRLLAVGEELFEFGVWNLDLLTGQGVPHFYNMENKGRLFGMELDRAKGELWVLYERWGELGYQSLNLKGEAKAGVRDVWDMEERPRAANFRLGGDGLYLAGTYAEGSRGDVLGMFFRASSEGRSRKAQVPFESMTGLKALLTDEKQKNSRRFRRLLEKGKPLDLPHEVLLHPVVTGNEQLVWTLELVAPVFQTEVYYEEGMDDRNERKTREVFLGWRNEYVLVVGTDREGKYLWDQAFSMDSEVGGRLQKRALVQETREGLRLTMVREEEVWQEELLQEIGNWKKGNPRKLTIANGGKPRSAIAWDGQFMVGYSLDGIGNATGTSWHSITSLWKIQP